MFVIRNISIAIIDYAIISEIAKSYLWTYPPRCDQIAQVVDCFLASAKYVHHQKLSLFLMAIHFTYLYYPSFCSCGYSLAVATANDLFFPDRPKLTHATFVARIPVRGYFSRLARFFHFNILQASVASNSD